MTALLFQSLHYPWCRFLVFAETCANSLGFVVSRKAASAGGSSGGEKKNQLGERKASANTSGFYFDLLHFVITITKGLWCVNIQVQADLFSSHTPKVVAPSCSLVCVCVCACKHFIVLRLTHLGNECWCLQGGRIVGMYISQICYCTVVESSVRRRLI